MIRGYCGTRDLKCSYLTTITYKKACFTFGFQVVLRKGQGPNFLPERTCATLPTQDMNASFTFPRPQPPVPRPAPVARLLSSQSPDLAGSRESNALRASILDTALELGISSNSLVADWMFNNPLTEEIEEEVSLFVFTTSLCFA